MNRILTLCIAVSSLVFIAARPSSTRGRIELTEEALALHRDSLLVDGHNDLPWALRYQMEDPLLTKTDLTKNQEELHTDIPKIKKGGLGAQFWSAYVSVDAVTPAKETFEQIALIHKIIEKYPKNFALALKAEDILKIRKAGKVASLIGVEGGHSMENSLDTLRALYAKGTRYMTLTHSKNTAWADSCTDKAVNHGLSKFGEEVVKEMNRLGMFVDISHVSAETMRHALRITQAPVIFSHSSAYSVKNHPRNVPDDVLLLTKANGGVVMVNFYTEFDCEGRRTNRLTCDVGTVADHIDHIVKVAGIDHVGVGSDFDGGITTPDQLSDVSYFPYLTQELLNRGYSHAEIKKILGENLIRAFKKMEEVAHRLQG